MKGRSIREFYHSVPVSDCPIRQSVIFVYLYEAILYGCLICFQWFELDYDHNADPSFSPLEQQVCVLKKRVEPFRVSGLQCYCWPHPPFRVNTRIWGFVTDVELNEKLWHQSIQQLAYLLLYAPWKFFRVASLRTLTPDVSISPDIFILSTHVLIHSTALAWMKVGIKKRRMPVTLL